MNELLTHKQICAGEELLMKQGIITLQDLITLKAECVRSKLEELIPETDPRYLVCCGLNQKGDLGLAIATVLKNSADDVTVCLVHTEGIEDRSKDATAKLQRMIATLNHLSISYKIYNGSTTPVIGKANIIDAILDAGDDFIAGTNAYNLVDQLNNSACKIISIDTPSGFPIDGPISTNHFAIHADIAISFNQVNINYFLPESFQFVKAFDVVDVLKDGYFEDDGTPTNQNKKLSIPEEDMNASGKSSYFIDNADEFVFNKLENVFPFQDFSTNYFLPTLEDIQKLLPVRPKFSHKGSFGHALIIAGNSHSMGAAIIAGESCLHTGAGLTTVCIPVSGFSAVNARIPEVMTLDQQAIVLPNRHYNAIGIGPGLGTNSAAAHLLNVVLDQYKGNLVLDADAINLLEQLPDFETKLQPGWILTPHMKEFDRLLGSHDNWFDRINTGSAFAVKNKVIIVLKNHYTFILLPNGNRLINTTGNPAMASGGMGDALTGIIVALLAQGLQPEQAAYAGCYLHGLTGDYLFSNGMAVVTATSIAKNIPKVIYNLHHH